MTARTEQTISSPMAQLLNRNDTESISTKWSGHTSTQNTANDDGPECSIYTGSTGDANKYQISIIRTTKWRKAECRTRQRKANPHQIPATAISHIDIEQVSAMLTVTTTPSKPQNETARTRRQQPHRWRQHRVKMEMTCMLPSQGDTDCKRQRLPKIPEHNRVQDQSISTAPSARSIPDIANHEVRTET